MLTILRIKNLALVSDLSLELHPGYNVITGETGAGKSILIGALNLLLGERADRSLIRSGADACSVEAVIHLDKLQSPVAALLDANGLEPCEDHQLVLKRVLTATGANRQFVNGSPTTLATLAQLGELLVDIHGPHEHQSLLNPARQLDILDAFAKLEPDRAAFASAVRRRTDLERQKADLVVDEQTYAQQLDLLRHQANEIEAARLQPEEQDQLEQDYRRATNAARLQQLAQEALAQLSEADPNLLSQAGAIGRALHELQRLDPSTASLAETHQQALIALQELQSDLSHYADRIDLDPARLQELEDRLNLIQSLKRKYGPTIPDILQFGEDARRKLASLEQRDTELARLNAELRKNETEIARLGQALSRKRRQVIPQLAKAASRQLADLGFKQSRLDIAIETLDPAKTDHVPASGLDTIEFQFAPNPGEPAKPLRAIASSGELARVMLALKTVLAAEDQVPILVFDEVDANVGGETAHVVGAKMCQIARNRQVLCITHLPQVAAPATSHYVVTKQTKAGRTTSEITLLDRTDRITELARMLGGQSEPARRHAEALLAR